MSENADPADDLDTIRQRKLERLRAGTDRPGEATAAEPTPASGDDTTPTPSTPIEIDGLDPFRTLLDRHEVVLADFSATWCGPCRALEPIVERVAARAPAAVATVDIDANPDLARQHSVRSVPTLLLFADGEPVERLVGVQDEAVLVDLIGRYA